MDRFPEVHDKSEETGRVPYAISVPEPKPDEAYMEEALREARAAGAEGEVPVGAVVVKDGRVIGRGHNQRELLRDPTAHAEMIAVTQAAAAVESWRLDGATMFVTLEPCPMCAGALVAARLGRLVFGAADPRAGACGSLYNLCADPRLNHAVPLTRDVRAGECTALLAEFFTSRRPAR